MNHNLTIGSKLKALRTSKKYTLKQLSEESGLSIGFLSQIERGMSSIAIDSLSKIADILGVSLSSFFEDSAPSAPDPVMRSFDLPCTQISSQIMQYLLSNDVGSYDILPRLIQLLPVPNPSKEDMVMMNHSGEEFIYILEGIVHALPRRQHPDPLQRVPQLAEFHQQDREASLHQRAESLQGAHGCPCVKYSVLMDGYI